MGNLHPHMGCPPRPSEKFGYYTRGEKTLILEGFSTQNGLFFLLYNLLVEHHPYANGHAPVVAVVVVPMSPQTLRWSCCEPYLLFWLFHIAFVHHPRAATPILHSYFPTQVWSYILVRRPKWPQQNGWYWVGCFTPTLAGRFLGLPALFLSAMCATGVEGPCASSGVPPTKAADHTCQVRSLSSTTTTPATRECPWAPGGASQAGAQVTP